MRSKARRIYPAWTCHLNYIPTKPIIKESIAEILSCFMSVQSLAIQLVRPWYTSLVFDAHI